MIVHDASKNFDSIEFCQLTSSMAICTKYIPVKAANSIGTVERYHTILCRAYVIIIEEIAGGTKELRLQMAVKAVNDTAGPDGLIPTLLVFGLYPRLSNMDPPAPTVTQRAAAIKEAMVEVAKCHIRWKVTDALRQRNGPYTDPIHNTPIGSEVLVWRTHLAKWTGPFKLLSIQGETCNVDMPHGPANFQITSVKLYLQQENNKFDPANDNNDEDNENHENLASDNDEPQQNPVQDRRLPSHYE